MLDGRAGSAPAPAAAQSARLNENKSVGVHGFYHTAI